MRTFGYRGLNGLERACVGFSFAGAFLAAFGAFKLVELTDRQLKTIIAIVAAGVVFFGVLTLMLKGIDEMKGERLRRLIKRAEDRLE